MQDTENLLLESRKEAKEWEQAAQEIRNIAESVQVYVYGRIEDLVTHALKYVFGDDYRCRIKVEEKRGKASAQLQVLKGDLVLDPVDACGGGVVDIVALALRLAAVVSDKGGRCRRLLLLDEPLKFLSVEYRARAAQLLQDLATELDFQVLIVTHDSDFVMGEVVRL